jgi:glycosyltransferase involved in cell wall biosynthesis
MRVALVHDWLTGFRGGEKVLDVLAEIFPQATLFTLLQVPGSTSPRIESLSIRTAFTQRLPGVARYYRWCLPLFPWAIESLDLRGFDLVISTSHCVAKSAVVSRGSLHICYCHTPMRYVWDQFEDYFGRGLKARLLFRPIAAWLRRWDALTADRPHRFVANSRHVAGRIRSFYGREADAVIYPPVDTDRFVPAEGNPEDFFLIVSALAPYKRIALAVDAFRERREPLFVIGKGPEEARLRARAGPGVRFLGEVGAEELVSLYQRCRATLLPGIEDLGIAPLESQACGRPVVAFAAGGALETVKPDETGVFFDQPTPQALSRAIDKVLALQFNRAALRAWAVRFGRERFKREMLEFVEKANAAFQTESS